MVRLVVLLALGFVWRPSHAFDRPAKPPPVAEDLGPAAIDVSGYPLEYQETYKKIFLPVYSFLGGPARAINSPRITEQEWKEEVGRIRRRPPCCGACPVLSLKDARALWRFLAYDSKVRKTGPNAERFQELRRKLLEQFEEQKRQQQQEEK